MQFLVNKREQIYDDMVIHINKSSLSYQQICEHYINASDVTPIANGTGDFIIVGARLFLKRPILIVKPTYVEKPGRKMETKIHEFKCMTEDLNLDPSKCFDIHGLQWLQLLCTMLTSHDKGDVLQKRSHRSTSYASY